MSATADSGLPTGRQESALLPLRRLGGLAGKNAGAPTGNSRVRPVVAVQTGARQLRRSEMFIASDPKPDHREPRRGGMMVRGEDHAAYGAWKNQGGEAFAINMSFLWSWLPVSWCRSRERDHHNPAGSGHPRRSSRQLAKAAGQPLLLDSDSPPNLQPIQGTLDVPWYYPGSTLVVRCITKQGTTRVLPGYYQGTMDRL